MKMQEHKKRIVAIVITLGVLLLVVAAVGSVALFSRSDKSDPYTENQANQSSKNSTGSDGEENTDTSASAEQTDQQATINPADVSVIDIPSLGISVSYKKGIQGFEYAVGRAAAGTQYVEFSNNGLIGTKCTNDTGIFASIVKNPSASDAATVVASKQVGSDTYGLTLPGGGCTADAEAFAQYQSAFKDGFPLLKAATSAPDTTQ